MPLILFHSLVINSQPVNGFDFFLNMIHLLYLDNTYKKNKAIWIGNVFDIEDKVLKLIYS